MEDKSKYIFHEKLHDNFRKSTKRIHCNFLEYVIIMREFEYLVDIIEYCKLLKERNIINDYILERNNVFIIDKKCFNNQEECCCLCAYKNNICKFEKEHGYCEKFQRLCW